LRNINNAHHVTANCTGEEHSVHHKLTITTLHIHTTASSHIISRTRVGLRLTKSA